MMKMPMLNDPQRLLDVSNYLYISAAVIAVIATFSIVYFGNKVGTLKDAQLQAYKTEANLHIAQANQASAESNRKAAEANEEAANAKVVAAEAQKRAEEAHLQTQVISRANTELRLELGRQEAETKAANAQLAAETQKVSQYAQGLAQQQQGMARQMQAAVSLNSHQIQLLGDALKPFVGQQVTLRLTMDSTSGRIANQLEQAFKLAGITIGPGTATYAGATYQGISVVVQKPQDHPPLADTLLKTFSELGIPAQGVAEPTFPANLVTICIGPQ